MFNDPTMREEDPRAVIRSYNRFVPYKLLNLLGKEKITEMFLGDQVERKMTILFSDIRNFTSLSEQMTPRENFQFINSYLSQMEPLISANNGVIDKFIGDAIMAIFPFSADDAVQAALLMVSQLRNYNEGRSRAGYDPVGIGIGLNTGLMMLGTVGGYNRMDCTVISDSVNLASRIESLTKSYGVPLLISEHTFHNLENPQRYGSRFIDRVLVKGKAQAQSVYEVFEKDVPEQYALKVETKPIFEEALANYHFGKLERAEELLDRCLSQNPGDFPAEVYRRRCREAVGGSHIRAEELNQNLVWSRNFELGEPTIDKQHCGLIKSSLKLIKAVEKGAESDEIARILYFLDRYVETHFQYEEKIMEAAEYPFIEHQRFQHRRFVEIFEQLKVELEELEMSKTYLMFRIQILIIDWIVNHTLKEDRHLGRYLAVEKRV